MKLLFILTFVLASTVIAQEEPNDPIEPINRGIFWFNDTVDTNLFSPVARGYDKVVPDKVEKSITNFFHNLRYPRYLVSDLIQLKFKQAATDTGRFLINSTIGLAGFFDVAESMGLPEIEKDVGLALQFQGVPPGPYIVLPFLGPSNVRDAIGSVADMVLDPLVIFSYSNVRAGVKDPIYYTATGIKYVNVRSGLIEAVDTAKQSSIDYYLFVQGAYYQHRWGQLWEGSPPDVGEEAAESAIENYRRLHLSKEQIQAAAERLPPGAME